MTSIFKKPNINSPKYSYIIKSIEEAISERALIKGDKLPSLNKVCMELQVSRDTVLIAYHELKKRGIVYSILGKGYYIKSSDVNFEKRFFLLFDELNSFKEDLYTSLLKELGDKAEVDIYFHHFNRKMFKKLVNDSKGNYSKYIIMPTKFEDARIDISSLPVEDVYILDQTHSSLMQYPGVFQNFSKDIFKALIKGLDKLKTYQHLKLIYPGNKEPEGMVLGFQQFAKAYRFPYSIQTNFFEEEIKHHTVYIVPSDRDLVSIIEQSKRQNLSIGKDFGIISYNDTVLKKVVENGITTISTDFKAMGSILAQMLLNNSKEQVENECELILRNSL
ncbi:GntR family transcriptional regulator [Psychroflexus sediminis]|uniref:Transcriptional regulator, GntR family n=1 Tax=Psychroflexus sediminis TaxID=470826 RepID=A0A1G7WEG1_9FLAO|nr:substrate-binding domain-containing protein [Psychroflexus sediminis]SDG70119.1 transcriptional regulator, GntR family [Psychroflexus sediminis]